MNRQKGPGGLIVSGLTLLEALIALCVLSVILSAVYGSYRAVTGPIADLQPRMALEQEGRFFIQRLSRQLRCCYGGPADPGKRSLLNPKEMKPALSEEEPRLFQGGPMLTNDLLLQFVTTSNTLSRNSNPGCLAVVSYKVDPWQRVLLACEEVFGRPANKDARDWRVVLGDLREMELHYFDGAQWQTQWDSGVVGGLPRAVRIKFVLGSDQDDTIHSFTSVAPIRCSTFRKTGVESQASVRIDEKGNR